MEVAPDECLDLLAAGSVGRIGFVDDDGPVVLPVNYFLHEGTILFRTAPHNSLGRHLENAAAVFEVDEFDDYTESGWSVVVRGRTRFLATDDLPRSMELVEPWPQGARSVVVQLVPRDLSGRRLLAT